MQLFRSMHSLTNQDVYCMCPVVKPMMLSRRFQYSLRSIFYLVIFPDHIFAVSERMRIYSLITVYTVVPDSLKTRVGQVSVSTAYNWQQWQIHNLRYYCCRAGTKLALTILQESGDRCKIIEARSALTLVTEKASCLLKCAPLTCKCLLTEQVVEEGTEW